MWPFLSPCLPSLWKTLSIKNSAWPMENKRIWNFTSYSSAWNCNNKAHPIPTLPLPSPCLYHEICLWVGIHDPQPLPTWIQHCRIGYGACQEVYPTRKFKHPKSFRPTKKLPRTLMRSKNTSRSIHPATPRNGDDAFPFSVAI